MEVEEMGGVNRENGSGGNFFFMNGNTERAQCALSRVYIP